jgi:hypothetical protein
MRSRAWRVAVDVFRVVARGVRGFGEGDGVVPTGSRRATFFRGTFEENAEGRGAGTEGGGDA